MVNPADVKIVVIACIIAALIWAECRSRGSSSRRSLSPDVRGRACHG
jgi:hypothetical protein